ncbi:MAG: 16S rRNA (cytosine(1402)-N(4))-methyltransferase RsmH [Oscillospiraceae bacterium]|nr:16S rRNA (cytosine(1402)-N(4))-methyltransferase RsmH [Oscillospiraceae bacterium]
MEHVPVMLRECIDGLGIKPDGLYVDGTLGRGGHSREIAKKLASGKLVAIDRDAEALRIARDSLAEYGDKIEFVHNNFGEIAHILEGLGNACCDGMLFDLGVSSPQLDNGERGFSYMQDAPLDMRMDIQIGETAFDAVNFWPEDKLKKIFYEFGEERYASLIARAIARKRAESKIETTFDLNEVILSAIPAAARREARHPSKKCFQALRIAVNDELGAIAKMLEAAPEKLNVGGRICIISFHSLEDRLVKGSFANKSKGCVCPKDFPVCVCGVVPILKTITKKPIIPGRDEVELNPRARSAKLRIAERI